MNTKYKTTFWKIDIELGINLCSDSELDFQQ